jgi:hypothetical protein
VAAERMLAEEARARSLTLEALRRERQQLYQKWSREAPQGEGAASEVVSTL